MSKLMPMKSLIEYLAMLAGMPETDLFWPLDWPGGEKARRFKTLHRWQFDITAPAIVQ
ncbi:hypothetical protein PIIN_05217 [Serendipita indica DSM 11827]|uniref:Uncharacterized protein n=1 Tax=Serendipita indica (strain DSM 11827) TaxID=1109443 RepID=G4TJ00_SERID|nr:hypothetical protein PIIN_05217 [Serendipita indica DSM 11827]